MIILAVYKFVTISGFKLAYLLERLQLVVDVLLKEELLYVISNVITRHSQVLDIHQRFIGSK
jgi:hypothetical protein